MQAAAAGAGSLLTRAFSGVPAAATTAGAQSRCCAAACQGVLSRLLSSLPHWAAPQDPQNQLEQHHWQLLQRQHYRAQPRPAAKRHRGSAAVAAAASSEDDSDRDDSYRGNRHHQAGRRDFKPSLQLRQRGQEEQQWQEAELAASALKQQWRQQWQQQQDQQLTRAQPTGKQPPHADDWRGGDQPPGWQPSSRNKHGHISGSSSGSSSHRQSARPPPRSPPRQASSSSSGVDAIGITAAISAAASLQKLQKLLSKHSEHLQQIHICAAYKAVVRLSVGLRQDSKGAAAAAPGTSLDANGSSSSSSSSSASSIGSTVPVDRSTAFELLGQLSTRMQQQIRVARPWDLAQAAWACSKLQYRDTKLLEAVAQQAQRKAAILTPQDISQLASAFARLSYTHPQLMRLLQTQAVAKAAAFEPWVLVHTAWALHTWGGGLQDVGELLRVALPLLRAPAQMQQLKGIDVSSLLWLMAGHTLYDEQLLQSAADHMASCVSSYSPASVANALMSFAALGFTTPALSQAAAAAVLSGLQQQQRYRPRQVAHCVFALARLQACDQALLDATAAAFAREPQAYSSPLLSMLVWVCVLARKQLPEGLLSELVRCSRQKLAEFSGDQLASLLRGLLGLSAQQGGDTPLLFAEAHALLPQTLPTVSTAVLSELIKSLSKHRMRHMQQQALPADAGSSSTSSPHGREGEQQDEVLLAMLQDCVAEWSKAGRLAQQQQLTHWQAVSVRAALEGCGQEHLAAVAQQVVEAVQEAAGRQQQQQLEQPPEAAATDRSVVDGDDAAADSQPDAGPSRAGTWVDSFVASTK